MTPLKLLLATVLLFILPVLSRAQAKAAPAGQNTASLKGKVVEDKKNRPLGGAVITLYIGRDSLHRVADMSGFFSMANLPSGSAKLRFSYLGYRTAEMHVDLTSASLDVGQVALTEKPNAVDSITVEYKPPLMTQTADTIKYNPMAVKSAPYDYAVDLIEKLPGLTLEDGKLTALGKDVKWALVDGKMLFGRNVMNALDNIKVSDIKSVNIYDVANPEKPVPDEYLDDEDKQRVIDIKTKSKFRNAYNIEAYGGWGLDLNNKETGGARNRYMAGGNIRKFSEKLVMTADVQGNNMNIPSMGYRGMFMQWGNNSSGYSRDNEVKFSIDRNNPFVKRKGPGVSVDYSFENRHNSNQSVSERIYFNDVNNRRDTSYTRTDSYTHNVRAEISQRIGRMTRISLNPTIKLTDNRSNSRSDQSVFTDGFNSLLTRMQTDNRSDKTGFSTSGNLNMFAPLKKYTPAPRDTTAKQESGPQGGPPSGPVATRITPSEGAMQAQMIMQRRRQMLPIFGFNFTWNYSDNESDGFRLRDEYRTTNGGTRTYLAMNTSGFTRKFGGSMGFNALRITENTQLNTRYSLNYDHSREMRMAFDTVNKILDPNDSYNYTRNYTTQSINAEIAWYNPDKNYEFKVSLEQQTSWTNRDEALPRPLFDQRTFTSWLPTFSIGSRFERSFEEKPYWNLRYSTSSSEPSLENLRNWLDTQNPLSLKLGNPDLKQSYTHSVDFVWGDRNTEKSASSFLRLSGRYTQNDIANKQVRFAKDTILTAYDDYKAQAGSSLTTYENIDGAVSASIDGNISRAVFSQKFIISGSAGLDFTRRPAYLSDVKNFTLSTSPKLNLSLRNNNSEVIDYSVSSNTSYTNASNTAGGINNTFSQRVTTRVNVRFLKHFTANASYQYYYYHSGKASDLNNNILNASLSCRFMKNSGEVRFAVFDILNRNREFTSSVYADYITNDWRQFLSRYFTLTFSYRFNKTGGGAGGPQGGSPGGYHGGYRGGYGGPGGYRGRTR